MAARIEALASARSVTRLCHITRSMALPFMVDAGEIRATSRLEAEDVAIFYPNDDLRLDGHKTHVSCSVQYPNAWFLRKVRARNPLFTDWIVLLIDPSPIWWEGTLFSPVNAAKDGGRHIGLGEEAFEGLYADFLSKGQRGRGFTHLASCPTDNQAEVLVPDGIPLDLVQCVVVADESQARREWWRMDALGIRLPGHGIAVCSEFFDPRLLSGRIASGVETDPDCLAWPGKDH